MESADRISGLISQYGPDAVFVDEGGVGGGVVDALRRLGHSIIPVNFGGSKGSDPSGTLVANKRAEMYVLLRDWLREAGAIDASDDLSDELVSIEYHFTKKQEIILVSKEDMRSIGKKSPDWADALAITFAFPVAKRSWRQPVQHTSDYDPLLFDQLPGAQVNPKVKERPRDGYLANMMRGH